MENQQSQNYTELPSTKKLIVSTIIAAFVAFVLLIIAVLPAEYGIDPTGIGQLIGLKEMGEIKILLEAEIQSLDNIDNSQQIPISDFQSTNQSNEPVTQQKENNFTFILMPGETTEFKLKMLEGAIVKYEWVVDKGHVNFNTHGDSPTTNYFGYGKGLKVQSDIGNIVAAFDGNHGWFWRNRSDEETTISLEISGDYISYKQF
ncbi:MAG: transmembrane anchor protein [Candidatus Marinimicrobia bacterium]|nr:transmembrane anchor protein [Candidatus Neomarinimicrobiota bacterium]MBT3683921.1 transmembrane anchor protein [Candidatus Neomarinimicrobiota bacterium]MBT3760845.1 transmembrane anchor protein [Candidatus Neomarinimicrobiota bacterium]MBT3896775.1 transmembrane anchor protein [Candidatus Neomarinimicrobiota bacterium]MBT4173931.1 transmembrane anchor protein [Candidatus Neomarinimicrobiota bacterium]